MERMTKSYATFDCDAHINDPMGIWDHVPESERELVRRAYWRNDSQGWLNGSTLVNGGGNGEYAPAGMYNPICLAGPQMNIKIIRRLLTMVPLTEEQRDYLEHKGATDPQERVKDLDLMGIDQVLVIPTKVIEHLPFVEDALGADAFCRAYNNFVADWCAAVPDRLFPAALLPLQDPELARRELVRVAEMGFRVALIRPIDAQGLYPNDLGALATTFRPGAAARGFDGLYRAFEDTGVVLGMHTFPAAAPHRTAGPGKLASPGELLLHAGCDSQTLSFVFEAQTWLAQVLLGGFLDRYSKLTMAVFESNSQWLPGMLEHCDRLFRLYANERRTRARRLPSEAFDAQCVISFEGDEAPTIRRWQRFEDIGIWSSDAYHHDAADAWRAITTMREAGVPEAVQAKLMGGNARRAYRIEAKRFVERQADVIERPEWFPQGAEFDAWVEAVAHPRSPDRAGDRQPSGSALA